MKIFGLRLKYKFKLLSADVTKKLVLTVLAVAAGAFFIWYAADGVVGPSRLTRWALVSDFSQLEQTVRQGCPEAEESENFDKVFSRGKLKAFFCFTEKGFYELCRETCTELGHAGNLSLAEPGDYLWLVNSLLSDYPGGYNGYFIYADYLNIEDPWFLTAVTQKGVIRYEKFASLLGGKLDAEELRLEQDQFEAPYPSIAFEDGGDTAVITISSMRADRIETDAETLRGFFERAAGCKTLVFDVSDQGFGCNEYWQSLLAAPVISETLSCTFAYSASQAEPVASFTKSLTGEYACSVEPSGAGFAGRVLIRTGENTRGAAATFARFASATGFAEADGEGFAPLFDDGGALCAMNYSRLLFSFSAIKAD